MHHIRRAALLSLIALMISGCRQEQNMPLQWTALPSLPDSEGFAAPFAGVHGDVLLVAGGAKFPDKRPWEGGVKKWYDTVFALPSPAAQWKVVGALPRPNGYGVSVSTADGVICAGGGDANEHFADVFLLRYESGAVSTRPLPPLPKRCAFMSGAAVGDTLYVAGGIETPAATECLPVFWALDLRDPSGGWRELDPCPGPPRMLAVAGSAGGSFYLFSGTKLYPKDGKPAREYLRDAWKYTPREGWKRLPDLPRAAVAAATPAPAIDGALLVVSGDDGANVGFTPPTAHPGFPRDVLAFDVRSEKWSVLPRGSAPFSRATVPVMEWRGQWVIPTGEARPGYRSPEVWGVSGKK